MIFVYFRSGSVRKGAQAGLSLHGRATSQCEIVSAMAISTGTNPMQFQRTVIFVDRTNLSLALTLPISWLGTSSRYSFLRVSQRWQTDHPDLPLYHSRASRPRTRKTPTNDVRVVLGHGIPTKDGNIREKAVDALLVADLIYHAASRNCDYAVLVSMDTDFVQAIRRVEDFGCRTSVIGICSDVPDRLIESIGVG